MIEGTAVIVFMLIVTIVVAIAVIVGLALVRRPAEQWQQHLREQNARFSDEALSSEMLVDPRETSLEDLFESASVDTSAYFDADRLPGIDRIEVVTDRIEAMHMHVQENLSGRRAEKAAAKTRNTRDVTSESEGEDPLGAGITS